MVERLFLAVPRGCLRLVIVVFPDHTHLLFLHELLQLEDESRAPFVLCLSKTCVKRRLLKDQRLVFTTNYRLMQVKSMAKCSKWSILQYFRPSFSYQCLLRSLFCLFLSGRLHRFYCICLKRQCTLHSISTIPLAGNRISKSGRPLDICTTDTNEKQ